MLLVRGVLAELVAMLNPVQPWKNVGLSLLAVIIAITVNLTQLLIVVVLIGGIMRLLERVF
jgi:hypothetical protein